MALNPITKPAQRVAFNLKEAATECSFLLARIWWAISVLGKLAIKGICIRQEAEYIGLALGVSQRTIIQVVEQEVQKAATIQGYVDSEYVLQNISKRLTERAAENDS